VDGRRHDRRRLTIPDQRNGSLDAPRRCGSRAGVDLAERRREQVGGQAFDLQHGQAARRRVGQRPGTIQRRHRQQSAGERRCAPHDADVAHHQATGRRR
jgi:hypothetical protein